MLIRVLILFAILFQFRCTTELNNDFELLPKEQTGITFSNDIKENLETSENLFDYDYFYNGAGVGIIDINNDGLQDVYFAANQKSNKLYLNQGDFKFKDITETAFANFKTNWSTGVSIVDINQDGLQDIYVCQSGAKSSSYRENLLFINNGDQTFTESANSFGLNDSGMSTQALFFDYDKDGDLDCFVMNESLAYGLDPKSFMRLNLEQKSRLYESYSHLYENEAGLFVDKTVELGLDQPTFGLGIKSCDVNNDGWPDIYISNDYYVPDMLYVNRKGKGFKDQIKQRTKQMSFYGMGMDIADINNDGHNDIFVLDMASGDHYRSKTLMRSMNTENFRLLVDGLQLPHQYMFNSLQLNSGNGTYNNIAHLAGVSSTDWSWSVLMEDFDFDGLKDIHVTNGYRKYALDNDFQKKVTDAKIKFDDQVPLTVKEQLYSDMPTEKLSNILYKNKGQMKFAPWSNDVNPPSYSNGAAIADFDNDGDPDLIVNNMDQEAFVFKNFVVENAKHNYLKIQNSKNPKLSITRAEVYTPNQKYFYEPRRVRGYMSSSEPSVFAGLGTETKIDSVKIILSDDQVLVTKKAKVNTSLKIDDFIDRLDIAVAYPRKSKSETIFTQMIAGNLGLDYEHQENDYDDFENEILLPYKQSSTGPFITIADFDNDGLEDLTISNGLGASIKLFKQNDSGFESFELPPELVNNEKESGEIEIADINNDGRKDFIIPGGGNEKPDLHPMYQSSIILSEGDKSYAQIDLPSTSGSSSVIKAFDYDLDGDKDVLVCKRQEAQKYPKHAASILYENIDGKFKDVTSSVFPALSDFGIINDVQITELNGDKSPDIILVGEWTKIGFFENNNSKFDNANLKYGIPDVNGLWFSIQSAHLNDDDKPDFIIGNIGENVKYNASFDKPLKIYGNDFDENGSWDLVLGKSYKNEYVPLRGLECSSEQMPFIGEKFETYDLFAKASLEDVYGPSLENAYHRYITSLSSIALLSQNNGTYNLIELPNEAQTFPVLDIEVSDLDKDGLDEIILSGNIYDTEVETPRLDAGQGMVLSYEEGLGFSPMASQKSGLNLEGNIKSTCILFHKGLGKQLLIASENSGPLKVFMFNK